MIDDEVEDNSFFDRLSKAFKTQLNRFAGWFKENDMVEEEKNSMGNEIIPFSDFFHENLDEFTTLEGSFELETKLQVEIYVFSNLYR